MRYGKLVNCFVSLIGFKGDLVCRKEHINQAKGEKQECMALCQETNQKKENWF